MKKVNKMPTLTATFRMIDDMSDKLEALSSCGEKMVEQFERIGRAADTAFDSIRGESTQAAQSVTAVAQSATTASQQVSDMGENLSRAAEATEQAAEETEKLSVETEDYGVKSVEAGEKGADAMKMLAETIQAAAIAKMLWEVVEAFGGCSEAASELETVAAKVATIADTSQMSISEINSSVLALSNETVQAAADLMDSVYNAISAGVDTAHAVEFTDHANKLAVGGFTSATTAVDVLTTALNAYGLEVEQVSQISDYLITSQNLGKLTVDEMAQSVGKVIPLAAAYGVEMDNLSTAYAVMTANGIATAETGTYLKSMLSELGDTGSDVAGILEDQTGMSFAELTEQGYSLGDILEILGEAAGGSTTEFANLWSSTEAGVGALSLFNSGAERYNAVLGQMATSAGATEAAYNTMMNTTEAAHQRLDAAVNNLSISIGNALNPALTKLYNGLADVLGGISEFLAEHPLIAKALTATTVGLGTVTAGVVAYATVTALSTPKVIAFGVAIKGAFATISWIPLAIGAVVTAGAAFISMLDDAEDETENLSDAVDTQAEEMELLEARYEAACNMYGETSDEALRLKEQMDELSESIEGSGESLEDSTEAITTWQDAATAAFNDVEGEVQALIQAYADAYNVALESFDGQFALFEEASMASEEYLNSNVENAQAALDSQLAYWETYTANIEKLAQVSAEQLGVTQANYDILMSFVRDGSVEAAGLAASMVENINSGNTQAITNLANTIGQVAEQRQAAASATAEWVTDFNDKMDELTASMERTVDELNLDTEAAAAARSTIQAYADSILANKSAAVSAATQVADAVEAALNSTNIQINSGYSYGFPGYATGTTDAEDIFMAGEEGPELIVGHEDATVFPASETDRIINAVNGTDGVVSVSFADELVAAMERYSSSHSYGGTILAAPEGVQDTPTSNSSQPQEKIIRVEINGSGSMAFGSGTSKQEVVDLMFDNLRPVLMSIVEEELFEEGDNSYDF